MNKTTWYVRRKGGLNWQDSDTVEPVLPSEWERIALEYKSLYEKACDDGMEIAEELAQLREDKGQWQRDFDAYRNEHNAIGKAIAEDRDDAREANAAKIDELTTLWAAHEAMTDERNALREKYEPVDLTAEAEEQAAKAE